MRRVLAAAALALLAQTAPLSHGALAADPAQIEKGRYLALAGDCVACHTVDPAKQMAGGYAVPTPFGAIYTPNISPDPQTGIGQWSDDEFVRAMHEGIGRNGEQLYPAFPYDSFTLLSRDDVLAIKAYLFSLPPVRNVVPANRLGFPFNQRWIMRGWKLVNFHAGRFTPDPAKPAAWNRGAYLVDALEHCGACHTPRNLAMGSETSRRFAGGAVGSWNAPNITPDPISGIGGWSAAALTSYLATGVAPGKARAAGPMAEAVTHSLSHLKSDDIAAIVTYLRDQKPVHLAADAAPRDSLGSAATFEAGLRGANGIASVAAPIGGAELFSANCAACHSATGAGVGDGAYPPLPHNTTVGASTPNNLVMTILSGVQRATPQGSAFMPGFDRLPDAQVAQLADYVEQQFGDPKLHVTAEQVAALRGGAGPAPPYLEIGGGALAAALVVLAGLALLWRRSHRGARAAH